MITRTRSNPLKSLAVVLACLAFGFGSIAGQDVDGVASVNRAAPAVAVDYASIIRFSSSREAVDGPGGVELAEATRPVTATLTADTTDTGATVASASAAKKVATSAAVTSVSPDAAASVVPVPPPEEESPGVEEMRRQTERPLHSQGLRGRHYVEKWEVPEVWSLGSQEAEWPDWVFEGTDLYVNEPPVYADIAPLPMFYVHPPMETELRRKVKKLARSKLFREVRRHTKRHWRKLFRDSPTMRFETYEETLAKINHIGKGGDEVDEFNEDYNVNEAKDYVFQRESRRGEADIPLFTWGPLTITAEGELRFDMGRAAATGDEEVIVEKVELGAEKAKPLFSGKDYKLNTSLRMSMDGDYTGGQNYAPFLSSYGLQVEVEWLSDILGRELVGAEFEVEFDDHGDVAAFFNFVIKSR